MSIDPVKIENAVEWTTMRSIIYENLELIDATHQGSQGSQNPPNIRIFKN